MGICDRPGSFHREMEARILPRRAPPDRGMGAVWTVLRLNHMVKCRAPQGPYFVWPNGMKNKVR